MSNDGKPKVSIDLARRAIELHVHFKRLKVERAERALKAARRTLELRERDLARYDRDGTKPTAFWFRNRMEDYAEQAREHAHAARRRPKIEIIEAPAVVIPDKLGGKQTAWVEGLLAKGARPKKNSA